MNELIVGIDLGTTNSELAVVQNGEIKVLPIHGNAIMPSCVGIDPTGKLIVGQAARNQLVAAPESTVLSIKRKMGTDTKVSLGGKEFTPEEISSFILRELKQEGERQLGQTIRKAVVTVPAFFNEQQRKATQIAGELAGLEVLRILNEPTAAALAYGGGSREGETMLVYDLGGGTFDVSVVTVESGIVEVKASHGDTLLGGDDFDQLLVEWAISHFNQAHSLDLKPDLKIQRRLKVILEAAKRRLSDEPFASVREEYLDGQRHLEMEIGRDLYEEKILPLLEKTLTCLHQSLSDAKLSPKDISKVMLVGGASRTPLVHHLLEGRMGLTPRFEINPDLIVAMGAAVQGSILAGAKHKSILVDITPHTFSTSALVGDMHLLECVPIIPRNTPLPASKAELFFTCFDNQKEIKVTAYQGEGPLPEENILIGDFMVDSLSPVPSGNPVIIHFDLDLNGMLKVTATEKNTGLAKSVTMDTRGAHNLDLEQARRNIASLTGDVSDIDASVESAIPAEDRQAQLTTAKDLRKRAEILLQKNLSPDDAGELSKLLHESSEAIAQGGELEEINNALSDLLFYLED